MEVMGSGDFWWFFLCPLSGFLVAGGRRENQGIALDKGRRIFEGLTMQEMQVVLRWLKVFPMQLVVNKMESLSECGFFLLQL